MERPDLLLADVVVQPGAGVAEIARQRHEQLDGAVAQVVVVPIVDALAVDDFRGVGLGELAGDPLVGVRPNAGLFVDNVRRVLTEFVSEVLPDRPDRDAALVGVDTTLDRELRVEVEFDACGVILLAVPLAERTGRTAEIPVGVDHHEHLLGVVGVLGEANLARPEELPGVLPDEQRHVGLFLEVFLVVQPLVDDGLGHPERERGVAAAVGREPLVGVDGRLGVVGEDADPLCALVAGVEEVLRVGDARDVDVRPPGDDVVRVVPVGGFGVVRLGAQVIGCPGGRSEYQS